VSDTVLAAKPTESHEQRSNSRLAGTA